MPGESILSFASFDEAYYRILSDLSMYGNVTAGTSDATSIGSRFGAAPRSTRELLCYSIAIRSPRARIISCRARNLDFRFLFANVLWTLTGRRDVATIAHYNTRGSIFSDDGKHFAGAIGHRMRENPSGDQLLEVINTLKKDVASRRAMIQIYSPIDLFTKPRDMPCMASFHFLMRDGRLSMITQMRSQSAAMVMPYDIFLLTMIHEIVASELGAQLGTYYHVSNSLHYYDDEHEIVTRILDEYRTQRAMPATRMIEMGDQPLTALRTLDLLESAFRGGQAIDDSYNRLSIFWQKFLDVICNNGAGQSLIIPATS